MLYILNRGPGLQAYNPPAVKVAGNTQAQFCAWRTRPRNVCIFEKMNQFENDRSLVRLLLLTFCRKRTTLTQTPDRTAPMSSKQANLLQGTLDLLVLKALGPGELHGLGISRRIEQITHGTFLVKPGSLFPALHRMEEAGWLSSFWGESENNRRAKFYRLTKAGKLQLEVETEQWTRVALAMTNALKAT